MLPMEKSVTFTGACANVHFEDYMCKILHDE